eukprot:1161484-Pelagomonas_calceolata.AAC.3
MMPYSTLVLSASSWASRVEGTRTASAADPSTHKPLAIRVPEVSTESTPSGSDADVNAGLTVCPRLQFQAGLGRKGPQDRAFLGTSWQRFSFTFKFIFRLQIIFSKPSRPIIYYRKVSAVREDHDVKAEHTSL